MRAKTTQGSARARLLAAALMMPFLLPLPSRAAPDGSFVKGALAEGVFSQFVGLIRKAGAADRLESGPVTVFMPTDKAFRRLPAKQRDALLALSPELTRRFVEHYVVPDVALLSKDIPKSVTMLDGSALGLAWRPGHLALNDGSGTAKGALATFVDGDVRAGQGLIQGIDTVLLPPAVKAEIDRVVTGGAPSPPAAAGAPPNASGPASASTGIAPGDAAKSSASGTGPAPAAEAAKPVPPEPSGSAGPPHASDASASTASASPPASPEAPTSPVAVPVSPPASGPALEPSGPAAPTAVPASAPPNPAETVAVSPPPVAAPPPPAPAEATYTARDIAGWKVRLSDGKRTGVVDRLIIGLPSGHLVAVTARFDTILGFGGKRVSIPWSKVTPDPQGKVLNVGMTTAEVNAPGMTTAEVNAPRK